MSLSCREDPEEPLTHIDEPKSLLVREALNSPAEARALTEIMLTIFRINGRLLEKGDALVRTLGITSAQWQVLGAVSLAAKPLTAPQIAEAMGITRQGVQKQLDRMTKEDLFEKRPNPRHERSSLYWPTPKGQQIYSEAMRRESLWAQELSEGLSGPELQGALDLLRQLHRRLEAPLPKEGE